MSGNLIWEWKYGQDIHGLSAWAAKLAVLIGFPVIFYLAVVALGPKFGGAVVATLGVAIFIGLVYLFGKLGARAYKLDPKRGIKVFAEGIKFNLVEYDVFYPVSDMVPGTLEMGNKLIANHFGGVTIAKAICFKTVHMMETVKLPVHYLNKKQLMELKNALDELKKPTV